MAFKQAEEKIVFQKKRVCRFCEEKSTGVDYKDVHVLKPFLTDRGKIIAARVSGNCAPHQRQTTAAIKRARNIALIAFEEER